MSQTPMRFLCPKQILTLPAYTQASQPQRDNMIIYCTVVLTQGRFGDDFVQISCEHFGRFLNVRKLSGIRSALSNFIQCDEHFSYRIEGSPKALGYRYAPHVMASDFVRVPLATKRGRELTESGTETFPRQLVLNGDLLPVHRMLADCLSKFEIDYAQLPEVLESLPLTTQVIAEWNALRWTSGNFYLVVGDAGRVHSSASNLKREVRSVLHVNGESTVEADVSCCQPVLLSALMRDRVPESELNEFAALTQAGLLYNEIAAENNETRESVKKALVKWMCGPWFDAEPYFDRKSLDGLSDESILAKTRLHQSLIAVHAWFNRRFPGVCSYMRAEKTNDAYRQEFNTLKRRQNGRTTQPYAVIANRLQRLESQIIIENCCSSLFKQNPAMPILTAHDALIVPVSYQEQVLAAMRESFNEFGLDPQISAKQQQKKKKTDREQTDRTQADGREAKA